MTSALSEASEFSPRQNALLAALPAAELARLAPYLELVPLTLGEVLHESDESMSHACFPVEGVVSLLYVMENGQSAEIAVVGHEGVIGTPLFMGGDSTKCRAVVQNAGYAFRLDARFLRRYFERGTALKRILLMYVSALIAQMVQTAACNRHHSLDQQFCRWILMTLDRLNDTSIVMTELLIGNMLGIEPEEVQSAARSLRQRGLIEYHDGVIEVQDRPGLEECTCECYRVVWSETQRLLPFSMETGRH